MANWQQRLQQHGYGGPDTADENAIFVDPAEYEDSPEEIVTAEVVAMLEHHGESPLSLVCGALYGSAAGASAKALFGKGGAARWFDSQPQFEMQREGAAEPRLRLAQPVGAEDELERAVLEAASAMLRERGGKERMSEIIARLYSSLPASKAYFAQAPKGGSKRTGARGWFEARPQHFVVSRHRKQRGERR